MRWVLVAYQAPAEPSTARVAAWRGLHRLGGLYLGPTVCVLPAQLAEAGRLDALLARVRSAGGTFEALEIEGFGPDAEARLQARYNEARTAEYGEIVERADALVAELQREAARGKVSFAEVEENEAGLTRIRQWLRRVVTRDLFGCEARQPAEAAVGRAGARLAAFTDKAIAREGGGRGADRTGLRVGGDSG